MDNSNECRPFKYVVTPADEKLVRNIQRYIDYKNVVKTAN